uniref:Guanine nucleotide-binding protein G(I) subunit alpha isoform X1 n=1 Tax=Hirondellea gigas TaxID=1518452 RepID=A0A6A7GBR4_9CRUS
MGICISTPADMASLQIDKKAREEQRATLFVKKFLLLGTGESGKSTIFKQLTHIYGEGFTVEDRMQFVGIIYNNVISSMKVLLEQSGIYRNGAVCDGEELDCAIPDELTASADIVLALASESVLTKEHADIMKSLWKSNGIQNVYKLRSDYQLNDSSGYFFDRLDAVVESDYCPTYDDMLRSRVRTTGIVETSFMISPNQFCVYDVGGQRNERRKWIHCFEGVTAVLFVVAISEYDQKLYEDESVNRMAEAMELFSEICNLKWFQETSMILFLNKSDLFLEKLKRKPISVFFKNYSGDRHDFDENWRYIKNQFEGLNHQDKEIYTHITCATDTNSVDQVFMAAKDIVIRASLRRGGLL